MGFLRLFFAVMLGFLLQIDSANAKQKVAGEQMHRLDAIIKKNHDKYLQLDGYNAMGKISFYSDKFNRRKTASGMRYSQSFDTAASRKLPLMSVVKVINLQNGKHTKVLINDRGLGGTNYMLDLSKNTVKKLGLQSNKHVLIEFDLDSTLALHNNLDAYKMFGI